MGKPNAQYRLDSRRRSLIAGALGVGLLGTAGCLGDGGDGDGSTVSVGHTGEGSISGGVALSAQRVMREQSDEVSIAPQGTGGDPSSMRLISEGDLDGALLNPYNIAFALDDIGPFAEQSIGAEDLPLQCFSGALMQVMWVARDGTGIEHTDDLVDSDATIWATDPEWGWYTLFEQLFSDVDVGGESFWSNIEDRIVPASSSDAPGALEEERIDAALVLAASKRGLPSYTAEKDARADLHALEVGADIQQVIEDHPAISGETAAPYGWEQDLGREEVYYLSVANSLWVTEDVSEDVVYGVMDTIHQNGDMMVEGSQTNLDVSEAENMAYASPGYSFHPGAAQWMQDNDVWDDSYSVGSPIV